MSKKRRPTSTLPITGLKGILPKPAAPVAIEDMNKGSGMPVQAIQKTPRYTRAELLAQCDPTAPRPEDMAIAATVVAFLWPLLMLAAIVLALVIGFNL